MRNGEEEIQDERLSLNSMVTDGNANMTSGRGMVETDGPSEAEYATPQREAYYESEAQAPALEVVSDLRSINIEPLSSGYKVKVGCQTVAVETSEKLVKMLGIYLKNPAEFEQKWYSKDTRNRLDNI